VNAGLSNLDTLRKHLLAGSLGAETKFDAVIAVIGLGVAGMFDKYCNRQLAYAEDAEIIFSGDRDHFVLPRYPVVAIDSIQTRYNDADAWQDSDDALVNSDSAAGLIRFYGPLGDHTLQVRVTFTGGYWFNTAEPDDEEFPGEQPVGATALPGDILSAFLLQCENVWESRDRLGAGIMSSPGGGGLLNTRLGILDLSPLVKQILKSHIRYQMT
jgi:hypothetical protein